MRSPIKEPGAAACFLSLFKNANAVNIGMRSGNLEMFDSVSVIFIDSRSDTQKNGRRVETSSGLASLRKFNLDSIADYEANAHGVFKSFKRMVTSAELGNASEYKQS